MTDTIINADAVIIGGGAAGLSAAVALARSLRSVVVIDAGEPRNAPADGAHNLLGREGIAPAELLRRGRDEARGYGAQIISGEVVNLVPTNPTAPINTTAPINPTAPTDSGPSADTSFDVTTGDGTRLRARRILLAGGLVDRLPDVAGLAPLWGRDVLHCPFCHGYEVRDKRIGVLGTGPMAMHQVLLFRQLSAQLTLLVHQIDALNPEQREQAAALGVRIIESPVHRVESDAAGRLRAAVLADGREIELDALVVAPRFDARTELFEALGGIPEESPMGRLIPTEMGGRTSIPGVWAAGNAADPMAMVGAAAAAGVMAGATINADLAATDLAVAVAARRTAG